MVGVSASVNLPLHHKVQKFSSGTGSPGWSRKKGRKMVVVVVVLSQPEKACSPSSAAVNTALYDSASLLMSIQQHFVRPFPVSNRTK